MDWGAVMGASGRHFNIWPIVGFLAVLLLLAALIIAGSAQCHGQSVPVPSFAQPQPQQPVYMVRAWTPVRNLLGWGPLYRANIAIGPSYPATVTPVAPLGVAR
jgi:hypothetical protein